MNETAADVRLAATFAAAMQRLGPFGSAPCLAVAVSGGADSTALALLARDWVAAQGGTLFALIIDHGLRTTSADEAAATLHRLHANNIAGRVITLDIPYGSQLQARARTARHTALANAAAAEGAVHLLFGHHAADQAETRIMRAARGPGGAAGIAAFAARHKVVLLRPLLGIAPADLRAALIRWRIDWIEDASNTDPRFERARVRAMMPPLMPMPPDPCDPEPAPIAFETAAHVRLFPEGFAVVHADHLAPSILAGLIRVIGGRLYSPGRAAVTRLANPLRSATLGGVRIMPAGRLGPGWLLCREANACASPVAAQQGTIWDGRYCVLVPPPGATTIGSVGRNAAGLRRETGLPSVVLRSLPAFFRGDDILSVPHLADSGTGAVLFAPPTPAVPAPSLTRPTSIHGIGKLVMTPISNFG